MKWENDAIEDLSSTPTILGVGHEPPLQHYLDIVSMTHNDTFPTGSNPAYSLISFRCLLVMRKEKKVLDFYYRFYCAIIKYCLHPFSTIHQSIKTRNTISTNTNKQQLIRYDREEIRLFLYNYSRQV